MLGVPPVEVAGGRTMTSTRPAHEDGATRTLGRVTITTFRCSWSRRSEKADLFYIAKFHAQLHQATRATVVAVSAGDVESALGTAPAMAAQTLQLAQEALQKASNVVVTDNEEIYLRLSHKAQAFAEAGIAMVQSLNGDGTFSHDQYMEGVYKLSLAVDELG